MIGLRTALALFMLLAGTVALAQDSPDGKLTIENAWARISPRETGTVNIFFDVLSNADTADKLLYATSPSAGKVTLRKGTWKGLDFHNTKATGVPIKPRRRTEFHPGVLEVTLGELTSPAVVGGAITVRLAFKNAGEVTITPTIGNQLLGNRTKK